MDFSYRYRAYAEALYHALTEDAFYMTLEDSVVHRNSPREAMYRYLEFSMQEAEGYGELYLPNGHTYGASIWSRPIGAEMDRNRKKEKQAFLLAEMGGESLNTYNAIVDFMSERSGTVIDQDFWYLSIVGLSPEFQGQGLGSGLIDRVLKKTDALDVGTYLETFTPRNMSFYERMGYRVSADFHEPTTGARYWVMVRDAVKG